MDPIQILREESDAIRTNPWGFGWAVLAGVAVVGLGIWLLFTMGYEGAIRARDGQIAELTTRLDGKDEKIAELQGKVDALPDLLRRVEELEKKAFAGALESEPKANVDLLVGPGTDPNTLSSFEDLFVNNGWVTRTAPLGSWAQAISGARLVLRPTTPEALASVKLALDAATLRYEIETVDGSVGLAIIRAWGSAATP